MYKNANKKLKIRNILKIVISLIVILLIYLILKEIIGNVNTITNLAKSAGIFGPIILILLISLGILISPIPSFILIISAGYIYGTWLGALYSYLGHIIAAFGTYMIVKFLNIKSKKNRYKKYKKMIRENKNLIYPLYIIPIVPISVTSIICARSKIKIKEFLKIIFLSFALPVLFFSFFGNLINNKNTVLVISLTGIIIIGGIITYIIIKNKKDL